MTNHAGIQTADITWQTDNDGRQIPLSSAFDDVYFSKANGLAETNYVFLHANDLPSRWATLAPQQSFTIIETGFGTGLNFLATCLSWQQHHHDNTHLHFISTEKFPLTKADLTQALAIWQISEPMLGSVIDELLVQYPLPLAGCHRLHFAHNIILDLWIGDAADSLAQMTAKADAWYLDGFAPAKNHAMWSSALFDEIARLSHRDTTLATFTAAGFVKRELVRIGATPIKIKGFAHKREMLTAKFDKFLPPPLAQAINTATVIGAGVSGLTMAYALANQGIHVTLIDKTAPLAGASGNPRALFAPKLSQANTAHDHLPTVSHLYAERFYHKLSQYAATEIFTQTGVIDFLEPHKKSHAKLSTLVDSYPNALISHYNSADNEIYPACQADFDGHTITAHIPQGGLINPRLLADFILGHPFISFVQQDITVLNTAVPTSDITVICAGFESHLLHPKIFDCRKIRGQVSFTPLANPATTTPIKYDGYCATFHHDDTPYLLMGASFVRNDTSTDIRHDEHKHNLNNFCQALPNLAQKLNINADNLQGRASVRAQTPDYHPIIGQLDANTFVMTAMGSKGFGFAPLCAEILTSLILQRPLPISQALLAKIDPHRPRLHMPLMDNV
ncbi:MAG: tRNA (5-methylaminomethyl-2-thiouridine)(34)-methyltransferase MnmD [Moraxella sp.]|nr:tRNA (5-methylaminomethyl-2-thiouridine)(34)-methyltransferase MnmD [Moraxella sp.]